MSFYCKHYEKKSEKKTISYKIMQETRRCEECKQEFPKYYVSTTSCCGKLKCGQTCAIRCDSNDCTSIVCYPNLRSSNCFGICEYHPETDFNELLTRSLFENEKDHDEKLKKTVLEYIMYSSSLNCLQQLLVSEVLDIFEYYPQLKGISIKNPFHVREELEEEQLISKNLQEELDDVKKQLANMSLCAWCHKNDDDKICFNCLYGQ